MPSLVVYIFRNRIYKRLRKAKFLYYINEYPSIKKFCGDKGYRKTFVANVKTILGLDTNISEKIIPKEFKVIPKRWIVERTFAWLNNSRRLSKDYEILTSSEEAMVKISHIYTLLIAIPKNRNNDRNLIIL